MARPETGHRLREAVRGRGRDRRVGGGHGADHRLARHKAGRRRLIDDCANTVYDLIAVPGGMPGTAHLRDSAALTALLTTRRDAGRPYAAICAAPVVVLQHHGLLARRAATCYPDFASRLDNPAQVDKHVVVDDTDGRCCITSRGPGTAIEFALKLIEVLYGAEKAHEIGARMLAR